MSELWEPIRSFGGCLKLNVAHTDTGHLSNENNQVVIVFKIIHTGGGDLEKFLTQTLKFFIVLELTSNIFWPSLYKNDIQCESSQYY